MSIKLNSALAGLAMAVGVALSAENAEADGMPTRGKMAAPAAPSAFSWTGYYFGGHIGGAWSDSKYTVYATGFPAATEAFDAASVSGGVQFVFQGQIGRFVVGTEVSLTGVNLEERRTSAAFPNRIFQSDIDWLITLAPRIGIAIDNWHLYLKGGLASADISRATYTAGSNAQRNGSTHIEKGWVIGGGFEMAMSPIMTLGMDYSYFMIDVPNRANGLPQFDAVGGGTRFLDHEVNVHSLTARLNFKLGQ